MKNPGSLSGDGANLRRDTTLRILRIVGEAVGLDQTIINLFDYAADDLHANWKRRDSSRLVYGRLKTACYRAILFAHGDFDRQRRADYTKRVTLVRQTFSPLPTIVIPLTIAGNPVHPMNWQRNGLMPDVIAAIKEHLSAK